MGEAKRKQSKREVFLIANPRCVYCGNPATTTDHCPPRCFFEGRQWPETYEFPACERCNASARLDEQALAVLIRSKVTMSVRGSTGQLEWEKLVRGLKNNQPQLVAEWTGITRNEQKHALREAFGSVGDRMRDLGWGVINHGPLTTAMTDRFMMKLGKALYYRHNGAIFDGVLYAYHINLFAKDHTADFMERILAKAPALPSIERNKQSLLDQFIYRFNYSPEHGVMYAVVQFGEQYIFQLVAMRRDAAAEIEAMAEREGKGIPVVGRHECFL